MKILENDRVKFVRSNDYNTNFSKITGYFERWGKTKEDDPDFSPYGPEIADIEISTICDQGCKFCYKSNTSTGINMSLDTFKKVFEKLPKTLTQIAFGVGSLTTSFYLRRKRK